MKKQDAYNLVVCASGGGGNFARVIAAQARIGFHVKMLVVDKECGAIMHAVSNNIPIARIADVHREEMFCEQFMKAIPKDTDLIVLAGFMSIIPASLCERWEGKMINTHPSLLPKFGGMGMYGVKVQEAVMRAGEKTAGCTVHFVSSEVDGGKTILQSEISVDYNETPWQLGGRVHKEENELLIRAIDLLKSRPRLFWEI